MSFRTAVDLRCRNLYVESAFLHGDNGAPLTARVHAEGVSPIAPRRHSWRGDPHGRIHPATCLLPGSTQSNRPDDERAEGHPAELGAGVSLGAMEMLGIPSWADYEPTAPPGAHAMTVCEGIGDQIT